MLCVSRRRRVQGRETVVGCGFDIRAPVEEKGGDGGFLVFLRRCVQGRDAAVDSYFDIRAPVE